MRIQLTITELWNKQHDLTWFMYLMLNEIGICEDIPVPAMWNVIFPARMYLLVDLNSGLWIGNNRFERIESIEIEIDFYVEIFWMFWQIVVCLPKRLSIFCAWLSFVRVWIGPLNYEQNHIWPFIILLYESKGSKWWLMNLRFRCDQPPTWE